MKKILALMAAALLLMFTAGTAQALSSKTVTYRGQGLTNGALTTEVCGTVNGAERDGGYILWVMTATHATSASISGPGFGGSMTRSGNGTFKFVSGWPQDGNLGSLVGNVTGTYTYEGRDKNVQLVISHGCPGEPPCDPDDPYGECYVCDPYDQNGSCYEGS
jgi:hypothetical protein